jgi:hypothetical protein
VGRVAREIASERVDEELREFAADGEGSAPVDPAFEEKLREKLWRMLRQRLGGAREDREPLD